MTHQMHPKSHSFRPHPFLWALLLVLATFLSGCIKDVEDDLPCAEQAWYQDADQDGLGNPAVSQFACEQPVGYVANDDDDNDICNLLVDACGVCGGDGPSNWYADTDGDGLGDPTAIQESCEQPDGYVANADDPDDTQDQSVSAVERTFGGRIDLGNLFNYANQNRPTYINKDNTVNNPITDAGATLGRVLFYDKSLSINNTIACASCHQQAAAFSDRSLVSPGVDGVTGRHSMRLINARFSDEVRFFWDERANSLEQQTTMPIQDHVEMGFSGQDGNPDIQDLVDKLEALDYYQELFTFVYGDANITEARVQEALAQFIRSIQSFDARFDQGRSQVANAQADFPNYSAEENLGKRLFLTPPGGANGGAGCGGCHRAPEFDIDPNSRNNGVIGVAGEPGLQDLTITRSPSLRDLVDPNGQLNGALMHDASLTTLLAVINHYDDITAAGNNNLDPRLRGGGGPGGPGGGTGQQLGLTEVEKDAIVAFLGTLTGTNVYVDERWSDPFQ